MAAAKKNIKIEKGATFRLKLIWQAGNGSPVDLTGFTARMQVRKTFSSEDKLLDMTTENGDIVLGGVSGTIYITGPASDTTAIPDNIKSGVYDLELVSGPDVKRLLEGEADISPEVTR